MKLKLTVRGVSDEAVATRLFELVDRNGAHLPSFTLGAHVNVEIPGGFVRQYSLCNDSADATDTLLPSCERLTAKGDHIRCTTTSPPEMS